MRVLFRLLSIPSLAALLTFSALGTGCSAGHDATEKELSELRTEVARLRAAQAALQERVDGIDIDRGAFGKGAATSGAPAAPAASPPGGAGATDRPELSVVRLSPSDGDGDADSDGPRPVIRAVGTEGSVQKGAASKGARPPLKKGAPGAAKKDASSTVNP